jgi:hypothetical protein
MIEAFFRSLKHSWIYLHTLDNFTALGRLIEFYVAAHNEVMPHSAFEGQTPDEMYFGTGDATATVQNVMRRSWDWFLGPDGTQYSNTPILFLYGVYQIGLV